MPDSPSSRFQAVRWLAVCAAASAAMLFLFDDSCQIDGGQHYLFARWAWVHHELFVGVWSRPLFTFLYAFPALVSFRAARALTVLIVWRLAGKPGGWPKPLRCPCAAQHCPALPSTIVLSLLC